MLIAPLRRAWPAIFLAGIPLAAGSFGARGPFSVVLNLGPHDSPFVSGFTPDYEVEGTSRVHWSTKNASVRLPLVVDGGPLTVTYRFARPLPGRAEVDGFLAGQLFDHFTFPGGRFRERRGTIPRHLRAKLDLSFRVNAEDPEGLGLRFDWIRIQGGDRATLRLASRARFALATIPLLLWLFFAATKWTPSSAALLAAPAALAIGAGCLTDPWLTYRLTACLPVAIAMLGTLLAIIGWRLRRRELISASDLRTLALLMMTTFVVRAIAVSHPDFYHPDLRTHARFVQIVREDGVGFLHSPASSIERHGVWMRRAYGKEYAFPYSPAFHLPFVLLPLDYDALVNVMPVVAAAWSILPMALLWLAARRVELSPWGVVLMAFVPTYLSRLSYALMPSLFGHVFDMALVCWLAVRPERLYQRGMWWRGALLVAASQLAYTSGVLNIGAFFIALTLVLFLQQPRRPGHWAPLLVWLGVGSAISFAVFYRNFLPMVLDVVSRAGASVPGTESMYPVRSFFAVSYQRTRSFFDGLYPLLAVGGLWTIVRRGRPERLALLGWAGAYLLLLFGRAKMPDLFIRGHETLFVTPLVCLASGEALAKLRRGGRLREGLALALLLALCIQGLYFQWRAIGAQMLPSP